MPSGPRVPKPGRVSKAVARNAMKHAICAAQPVLAEEDPWVYQTLLDNLVSELRPVGVLETALVERIGLTLWRQQRLVRAEAATLQLQLTERELLARVQEVVSTGAWGMPAVSEVPSEPVDQAHLDWCQETLTLLQSLDPEQLELADGAPEVRILVEKLNNSIAAMGPPGVADAVAQCGGLPNYLRELAAWCRTQLERAQQRMQLRAVAALVRDEYSIIASEQRERLGKYQVQLDNELSKNLKTLRERQAWRMQSLEPHRDL